MSGGTGKLPSLPSRDHKKDPPQGLGRFRQEGKNFGGDRRHLEGAHAGETEDHPSAEDVAKAGGGQHGG